MHSVAEIHLKYNTAKQLSFIVYKNLLKWTNLRFWQIELLWTTPHTLKHSEHNKYVQITKIIQQNYLINPQTERLILIMRQNSKHTTRG